jgi:hypothetical protein
MTNNQITMTKQEEKLVIICPAPADPLRRRICDLVIGYLFVTWKLVIGDWSGAIDVIH